MSVTWSVHKMWRVVEPGGPRRRGTFTLCTGPQQGIAVFGQKGIIVFDDGTRDEIEEAPVVTQPFVDDEIGKKHPGTITIGSYWFEIMRELPVTAPTIRQHVVSAPVIPRLKRRKG